VKGGALVSRTWFVMMHSGILAVDWGNGLFLDPQAGTFFPAEEKDVSHPVQDVDLEWAKHVGYVDDYDAETVFLKSLPDLPRLTLD
jgi:hypothetical protein